MDTLFTFLRPAANHRSRFRRKDTTILLEHYKFDNIVSDHLRAKNGTPQGKPFSERPVLDVRCIATRPIGSFDVPKKPRRRPIDPRKYKNFRSICWIHTESSLLAKSPLNDTTNRALMPTRPIIPPRSQTPPSTPVPSPPKRPSNALRRFGTILPGSTLQSYRLSTPLSRDARGRAPSEASKPPCLIPNDLPTPPPGVVAKDALSPWPGNTRIMVHRMNISRHEWNTLRIRIESVTRYIRLALEVSSSTARSAPRLAAHPLEFIRIADTINGIFVHTKRMAVIGCDRRRHEEVEALAVVRAAIHELTQTEIATEPSISLPLESGPSPEALVATGMNTMVHAEIESPRPSRALTRDPRATSSFRHHQPIAGMSHRHHLLSAEGPTSANSASFSRQSVGHSSICGLQSTITDQEQLAGPSQESPFPEKAPTPTQKQSPGPDPQPRQKRSRVRTRPAPYSVPSTRILRSMTKAKEAHSSTSSTAPPNDVPSRTAVPRRQLRKESKARPIPSTDVVTPPKAIAPDTSRYNLRPRKRELDNSGIPPTVGKQIDRPAKRRRT